MSETSERDAGLTALIPGRPLSWTVLGIGVVLIALGGFVTTGEISGLLGLWGLSLIVVTLGVYAVAALWSALGSE
ncbi:hypothetical protein [Halocatena pleomorpha]|uniref:Uncharacterized protein n=1 Tax=Halocatena pleomorpha TaxID=1785090 RepID=A0A3P3R9M3_9EURY|nr:hypothetical protein [Halocatena pleomorpha]RRJ30104.1 hypothetical protein EIK79_11010 [Halocatena pleomorpha]